ncbi:MAG TPA: malate synthase A [Elusimicrobiota bacterium]|nr:malate synthase A [Elusimicrobiota bacterium]
MIDRPRAVAAPSTLPSAGEILSDDALGFLAELHERFDTRRRELLAARIERQKRFDAGDLPDFLAETRGIRESDWTVAPIPRDLLDRRVEITGPVDRKMIINALNSGANVFMADFEDANSPTWENMIQGQINLTQAIDRELGFTSEEGKTYELKDKTAVLFVRPRGWHLPEKHFVVDGEASPGALFDFGLFFFHNAKALLERRTGPYFYLPKLESHLEARLWNDAFLWAQKELGLPRGTIRATVLIETLPAAFEMHEILHELRDHVVGLNCGRWDYIFSFIKKFARRPEFVLPDRAQLAMTTHFLRSYSRLLIETCHRRGAHAMGGMAAQIPVKDDAAANEAALAKVRADKVREAEDGHDGTWVAHPGLVPVARDIFDRLMPGPNQLDKLPPEPSAGPGDLLRVPEVQVTEAGLRVNLDVGLRYLSAWLSGNGCVPIYNLMEDAATAEISRAQVWQWARHGAKLEDGRRVGVQLARQLLAQELDRLIPEERWPAERCRLAAELYGRLIEAEDFPPFLTEPAYELID